MGTEPDPVSAQPPPRPPASSDAASADSAGPQYRRAERSLDRAWLGGVCVGLARHLNWPLTAVRVMFVLLMLANFIGVAIYAVLWLILPLERPADAPGLESASRTGRRPARERGAGRRGEWHRIVPLLLLGGGLAGLVQGSGIALAPQFFWPIAFAGSGVALVWGTADLADDTANGHWYAPLLSSGRTMTIARVALGLALIGGAVGIVLAIRGQVEALPQILVLAALLTAGIGIVAAPWWHRSRRALREAREEKVRADERADVAAHLHDSVLQTLALIQRQADDPKTVAALARRQERELRTWLYGDVINEASLRAALTAATTEVEDEWGVPMELVCVGDTPVTPGVEALVRAGREAMVNAAKHSGADHVDIFAEVAGDSAEVFVRDRGCGFDPESLPEDRQGVRRSITDRMERHGGHADVISAPGEGTEIRLRMPLAGPA